MADYSDSRRAPGAIYPDSAIETGWQDLEPLLSPQKLRTIHLFGIPLVSAIKNPFTGRPDVMTDDVLKEHILEAAAIAESELGGGDFNIFPRQFQERHPYDQVQMDSFGYIQLRHRPVVSVESFAVQSSDGVNIWTVPKEWIEPGYLHRGQLHVIPFAVASASGATLPLSGTTGLALLPSLFRFHWIPALWSIKATAGWEDSLIPKIVNQLIGTVAAMEILSNLAITYARSQSSSLSIDGLSQSSSTPGPELFAIRMRELGEKRKFLIKKISRSCGLGLFTDNF